MSHRKRQNSLWWLLLVVLVLSVAQVALAEENEGFCTVELKLFSHGEFPSVGSSVSLVQRSDFDAYVLNQLKNYATEIDVSSYRISGDAIYSRFENLLNTHPEMFYVGSKLSWYYSGDYVSRIVPTYLYPQSEIPARVAAFDQAVNTVVRYANQASTIEGKLMLANDYLCAHYEYDTTFQINSADQFFAQGKGVCQAYAMAYKAVLDRMGFTNTTASSEAMDHIWNVVLVNGNWYHIDVTWNDPRDDVPLRAYHDYLLLSDSAMLNLEHHSWETSVTCTSTAYDNYIWRTIDSSIPVLGDTMYYTRQKSGTTFAFNAYHFPTGATEELFTYTVSRVVNPDLEPPLWVTSSHYYYCTFNKIYSRSRSTGEETLLYTLTSGSPFPYITYFAPKGNELWFVDYFTQKAYSIPFAVPDYQLSLSHSQLQITAGETAALTAIITPEPLDTVPVVWTSTNDEVATVDATGSITAVAPGCVSISAAIDEQKVAECIVIVHDDQPLTLPANTMTIEEESFAGICTREVILPEGLTAIGCRSFADNADLRLVTLPESLTTIAENAFENCENVIFLCTKGGSVETLLNGLSWNYLPIEE